MLLRFRTLIRLGLYASEALLAALLSTGFHWQDSDCNMDFHGRRSPGDVRVFDRSYTLLLSRKVLRMSEKPFKKSL